VQTGAFTNKEVSLPDTLSKSSVRPVLAIPESMTTYFAFDKSEYKPVPVMDKYSADSKAFIDQNIEVKLSITGYTDAIGTDEYNLELGYRRAKSMQNYFEGKGIPSSKILIESKGEKEPADNNNTISGRSNNRRAVITLKK
jgi:OOP family OmpA-OmpF porin